MIDFIQDNKAWVIVGGVIALAIINWEYLAPLWSFAKRARSTTPSDRLSLYNCLIEAQNLLVKCGVDREKLDEMTLAEVADVATTGNYEKDT